MTLQFATQPNLPRALRVAGACLALGVAALLVTTPARAEWPAVFKAETGKTMRIVASKFSVQNGAKFLYVAGTFTGSPSVMLKNNQMKVLKEVPRSVDSTASYFGTGGDIFVAKLDDDGAVEWVTQAGSPLDDSVSAIDVDDDGNVYLTGGFCAGTRPKTFPANHNPAPDVYWGKNDNPTTPSCSISFMIEEDPVPPITLANNTYGRETDDKGTWCNGDEDTRKVYFDNYQQEMYVAKISPGGSWVWELGAGGMLQDYGGDLVAVGTDGLVVSGTVSGVARVGEIIVHSFFPEKLNPTLVGGNVYRGDVEQCYAVPFVAQISGTSTTRPKWVATAGDTANEHFLTSTRKNDAGTWVHDPFSPRLAKTRQDGMPGTTTSVGDTVFALGIAAKKGQAPRLTMVELLADTMGVTAQNSGAVLSETPDGSGPVSIVLRAGLGATESLVPAEGTLLHIAEHPDFPQRLRRMRTWRSGQDGFLQRAEATIDAQGDPIDPVVVAGDEFGNLQVAGRFARQLSFQRTNTTARSLGAFAGGTKLGIFLAELGPPGQGWADSPISPTYVSGNGSMFPGTVAVTGFDVAVGGWVEGGLNVKFGDYPLDCAGNCAFVARALFGAWPTKQGWVVGEGISPPPGALAMKPDWNANSDPQDFYWSEKNQKLYPLHAAGLATIKWLRDPPDLVNKYLPAVSSPVTWPTTNVQVHIAGAPVDLQPLKPGKYCSAVSGDHRGRACTDDSDCGTSAPCLDADAKRCSVGVPRSCNTDADCAFSNPCTLPFPDKAYALADTAPDIPLLYTETGASVNADKVFTANTTGYSVLRYKAADGADLLEVVQTMTATPALRTDCEIGSPVPRVNPFEDPTHADPEGRNGWVMNENARYNPDAYNRAKREGPIIPVNTNADLAVAWYQMNSKGIAWPVTAERFDCPWPGDVERIFVGNELGSDAAQCRSSFGFTGKLCTTETQETDCGKILGGSDPCVEQEALVPPTFNGTLSVYRQPYPTQPGYNPNEEHAKLFNSQKNNSNLAVYALRTDYNGTHCSTATTTACTPTNAQCPDGQTCDGEHCAIATTTACTTNAQCSDGQTCVGSDPYVLINYTDANGQPAMKVYKVELDPSNGPPPQPITVTEQVVPPYPLSAPQLMGTGGCAETCAPTAEECAAGTACDPTLCASRPSYALFKDAIDFRLWARAPGPIKIQYSYPLLDEFYYPGTNRPVCVDWLGKPDGSQTAFSYQADWPPPSSPGPTPPRFFPPRLLVGETLRDSATDPGLPGIAFANGAQVVFETTNPQVAQPAAQPANEPGKLVRLYDPMGERKSDTTLATLPDGILEKLTPSLQKRLTYDIPSQKLVFKGWQDPNPGKPFILPNVMTPKEKEYLLNLGGGDPWNHAVEELYAKSRNPMGVDTNNDGKVDAQDDGLKLGFQADGVTPVTLRQTGLALTAGAAQGTGYVTLALKNPSGATNELRLIQVGCGPYQGEVRAIQSDNVFDDKVTVRHSGDFGGDPSDLTFDWYYAPKNTFCPDLDPHVPFEAQTSPAPSSLPGMWSALVSGMGFGDYTFTGAGTKTLADGCVLVRYTGYDFCPQQKYSQWAGSSSVDEETDPRAQLVPGWVSRVLARLNLFDQPQDFHDPTADVNTFSSAIAKAGPRPTHDVVLNPDPHVLYNQGLIELYETVLNKARDLSIDADLPAEELDSLDNVDSKLLDVSGRIADLYMLLGNEAWQDALDPTIGWSTTDGEVGSAATGIFAFQNQVDSLLDEELALLRGLDHKGDYPEYNRLTWNLTQGAEGQVAYVQNYGIRVYDNKTNTASNGTIDAAQAAEFYPQGHGDAWGHYLTAITTYYRLLRHPHFNWLPRADSVLVGSREVKVDFADERRFAKAAAARARTGAQILNLTYRKSWVDDPAGQWQGYKEDKGHENRAWGVFDWAERAGQGAYFDWVVANAILPPHSPQPPGIEKIDRTTVPELQEIASQAQQVAQQLDLVDQGLNPLGLAKNVVPFDIKPNVDDPIFGGTHFEQIAKRAKKALVNAVTVFNRANKYTQLLRRNQDSNVDFGRDIAAQVRDYNNRLIEIFGTPYPEDTVDKGGVWPVGYTGPDTLDYDVVDVSDITGGKPGDIEGVKVCNGGSNDGQPCARTDECPDDDVSKPTHPCEVSSANVQEYPITVSVPELEACPDGKDSNDLCQTDPYLPTPGAPPGSVQPTPAPRPGCTCLFDSSGGTLKYNDDGSVATHDASLTVRLSTVGFGRVKPASWSARQSPGELQIAHSELLQARAQFERALKSYSALIGDIECVYSTIKGQNKLAEEKLTVSYGKLNTKIAFNSLIVAAHIAEITFRHLKDKSDQLFDDLSKSLPMVVGVDNDAFAPARAALYITKESVSTGWEIAEEGAETTGLTLEKAQEVAEDVQDIKLEGLEDDFEIFNLLGTLGEKVRQEPVLQVEVFTAAENVRQAQARWQATLAKGLRLADELATFRRNTAAKVAEARYNDVAFRLFRNDALQKYRAQFDQAARYVYLAAAAYDYETNFPGDNTVNSRSGRRFLTDIVRERGLGDVSGDGDPTLGATGLSDPLATMLSKYESSGLGFDNPASRKRQFSLRKELFRLLPGAQSDADWREKLAAARVKNLWDVPDFRRFASPPRKETDGPIPGIVIAFPTTVTETENFFGWPSGIGDSAFPADFFATRVRKLGVSFGNYVGVLGTGSPSVYLFPAGADVLRSPLSGNFDTRKWTVIDQIIPTPEDVSGLDQLTWRPSFSLDAPFGGLHKFTSIDAAYEGNMNLDEPYQDSRAIGRSVWNTRWVLIIPGTRLLGTDPNEGINLFIYGNKIEGGGRIVDPDGHPRDGKGVSDIVLYLQSYAYAGQ